MNKKITVLIYTHNEEKNIADCLKSALILSNEITIIDMESSDQTTTLALKLGAKVIKFPFSHYVEPARKFGIDQAKTEWVLILDADERITQDLAQEIKKSLNSKEFTYYKIPRKNIFETTWLKHGGWWPDYQTRLIDKKFLKNWPKQIHSTPTIKGRVAFLQNPLDHYFHGNIEKMVEKTLVFENVEADLLLTANKKVSAVIFFRKFLGELFRRLIRHLGFLDGSIGIIESIYQAFSKTITYLFLYEKQKDRPL